MSDAEKWMLAAAYKLAGMDSIGKQIVRTAGVTVKSYQESGGTYGSTLRDMAIILEQLVIFENWELALKLFKEISEMLSTTTWYSTQTTGYSLLALGKYLSANRFRGKAPQISGYIIFGNEKIPFSTQNITSLPVIH